MARFESMRAYRAELHGTSAFAAVAILLGVAFGLSTLITPLYVIYQQSFGLSQITLTLIYAAYAIGNIAALLLFGHVSDHAGRRPTALSAIATLVVAAFVFLFANGVAALYIGRILSGLGIGIASGTAMPGSPNWSARTTRRALPSSAPAATSLASVSRRYFRACLQSMGRGCCTCRSSSISLSWARRQQWFGSPRRPCGIPTPAASRFVRNCRCRPKSARHFVAPAITGFGLMALVGFYAALMPSILSHDLGIKNHAAAGALLFALATVVALGRVLIKREMSAFGAKADMRRSPRNFAF